MRVGLVIREQRPEFGGAFTFQSEVLRAFSALHAESRHSFLVLCPTEGVAAYARGVFPEGMDLACHAEAAPPLRQRVSRRLGLSDGSNGSPTDWRTRIERLAREREVQFIWVVSHGEAWFDIPYMTIVWDLEHRNTPWFPEIAAGGLWEQRESTFAHDLPRAAVVIAGTQVGKREIHEFYRVPESRIRVLPHPTPALDDVADETAPPLPGELGRHRPFVFYPAQFWPHKNHANLVLALARLREQGLDLDLALVGSDKGNRQHIEAIVDRQGLRDRVHFLGFVEHRMLVALYRRAVALAYVSFCGPENLPPLEAFALGCPVLAADIAGAREQLGENAVLVDPADPGSIAEGLKRIAADAALRARLVEGGRRRAAAWTPVHFVRAVFGILDEFEATRRAWP